MTERVTPAWADPYHALGVEPEASLQELRVARRRLAKALHPDLHAGRGSRAMADINIAFHLAAARLSPPTRSAADQEADQPPDHEGDQEPDQEVGFTVDVLPAEACEALIVACRILGEVLSTDEPYRLEAYLDSPDPCFCVFTLVPEAGGSIVSMALEAADGSPSPDADAVRDAVVDELTRLTRPASR